MQCLGVEYEHAGSSQINKEPARANSLLAVRAFL